MYLGDAILEDWKEAIDLLKAAHKYQMESLVQKCAHYLQDHIDLSNVCYIYSKAVTYTLSPLGNIKFYSYFFTFVLFVLLFTIFHNYHNYHISIEDCCVNFIYFY